MPPIAQHKGVTLVTPEGNTELNEIFEALGGCLETKSQEDLAIFQTITCMMGPYYLT